MCYVIADTISKMLKSKNSEKHSMCEYEKELKVSIRIYSRRDVTENQPDKD